MTDWIEHTGDTCPVDPETVVEVRLRNGLFGYPRRAGGAGWGSFLEGSEKRRKHPYDITHYRIITPAKPPEPKMAKTAQEHAAAMFATAIKPEPDLIALRLECLKLASKAIHVSDPDDWTEFADTLLHYVLNGSVDKA